MFLFQLIVSFFIGIFVAKFCKKHDIGVFTGIALTVALSLLFGAICINAGYADEGKRIYTTTCVKCHNANPTKAGSIGPELFTTPKAVFSTKVPTGVYPAGYKPKRKTKIMPKFPLLDKKIDLLYKYIQTFKGKK
jgi:mono/diheme cytochrome c family protein